jgi:Phytanoyl-CoA dioxygenase (PhyH)
MIFSEAEIERFMTDGYVVLRRGFSREVAAEGRAFVWWKLALPPDDPAAWHQRMIHVREPFSNDPFDRILNPRLVEALDQIMGAGRAMIHDHFGWWPVLFPGFKGRGGWHVDGDDFHHHLTSPEQGLVTVFLFSDVSTGDGGTAVAVGSHHAVAHLLGDAEPAGLRYQDLLRKLPSVGGTQVVELTGEAGDVAMLHPFLIHGFSANTGTRVRFACNPRYSLKEPMQLDRADRAYSPVEEAIRRALGLR